MSHTLRPHCPRSAPPAVNAPDFGTSTGFLSKVCSNVRIPVPASCSPACSLSRDSFVRHRLQPCHVKPRIEDAYPPTHRQGIGISISTTQSATL